MKKIFYNGVIILCDEAHALVTPQFSPDGFMNYYN